MKVLSLFKSGLVKDSASYTIFNILEKAFPFLLLPVITRRLPIEQVGLYMLYQALIEVIIPLVTCNIDQSIMINFYKHDKKKFSLYFINSMYAFFFTYLIFFLIGYWNAELISKWLQFPSDWFLILILIILFRFFTQVRLNIYRVLFKRKNYGFFVTMLSLTTNLTGILLLLYTDLGWKGLILGHLIGYTIFGFFSFLSLYKEMIETFMFSSSFIKDIFNIGIPMSFHRIGIWLGSTVNRIIIASVLGEAATGSYGIGATFATIITILEDAISKAFTPHLYKMLQDANSQSKKTIVKTSFGFYIFLIAATIMIYFFGYYAVEFIFGPKYVETKKFIVPLLLSAMFKGFYKLHVHYIFFTKRTIEVTKITFAMGIINIPLAYYLVSNFGITGAAYSLLVVSIIQYLYIFYVSDKLIPMPWSKTISLIFHNNKWIS